MRRIALLSALTALTCSTLFQAGIAAQAASPADVAVVATAKKKAKQVATPYALRAVGHGTYINGGELPITSGATGQAQIACTTIAGVTRSNRVAGVDVPGLGRINGVRTRVWTTKKNRTVSSYAQHDIADIKLIDAGVFSLSISGLQSRVRVWKNPSGYHAKADTKILSLKLNVPGLDPIDLTLPSLNRPIIVPELLQINAGEAVTVEKKRSAFARAQVLQIKILPTNTTIRVGLSRARITDGIVNSAMGGFAAGLRAQVLPPLVGAGRTPVKSLPCQGTDGKALRDSLVGVNVPGLIEVGAAKVSVWGRQAGRRARGWTEAELADINILGGTIVIEGVKARANVARRPGKIVRNNRGSAAVKITVNGTAYDVPLGGLEIPGVVKIEEGVTTRTKKGIEVVGLRLSLLDGTGAVIDLGIAKANIRGVPKPRNI